MINHEKLQKIEEAYLGYLPDYWSGESYKWKAIKQFQDHWDIEASWKDRGRRPFSAALFSKIQTLCGRLE